MTDAHDAGEDLLAILADLEDLISGARGVPMSSSVIVGREDVLTLVDRARRAVPQAVRRAEDIVADADAVLADGQAEADQIIARAQEEADRLVSAENVVRLATERADEIVSAAEEQAERLRRGADDYCDRSLASLEIEIGRLADQVAAGRQVLASRLEEDDAARPVASTEHKGRRGAGWFVDPAHS